MDEESEQTTDVSEHRRWIERNVRYPEWMSSLFSRVERRKTTTMNDEEFNLTYPDQSFDMFESKCPGWLVVVASDGYGLLFVKCWDYDESTEQEHMNDLMAYRWVYGWEWNLLNELAFLRSSKIDYVRVWKVALITRWFSLLTFFSSRENEYQSENIGRNDRSSAKKSWRWTHWNHIETCGTGSRNGHCVRCFPSYPGECHQLTRGSRLVSEGNQSQKRHSMVSLRAPNRWRLSKPSGKIAHWESTLSYSLIIMNCLPFSIGLVTTGEDQSNRNWTPENVPRHAQSSNCSDEVDSRVDYLFLFLQNKRQYSETDERRQTSNGHVDSISLTIGSDRSRHWHVPRRESPFMNIVVASGNDQQRKFENSTLTFTDVRGVVINSRKDLLSSSLIFAILVLDRLTNACEALKKQICELNVVIDGQPFQESEEKRIWNDQSASAIVNVIKIKIDKVREIDWASTMASMCVRGTF